MARSGHQEDLNLKPDAEFVATKPLIKGITKLTSEKLFDLAGRVIVVTGGLGQLGRVYSEELFARGAKVAILDAGLERSEQLEFGFGISADVTDRVSLAEALKEIEKRFGRPFGLINNAAIDAPPNSDSADNGPYETTSPDSFRRVLDVNVTGVHLCCQIFGHRMAEAGSGSIINVSSIYGIVSPDQRIYDYRRRRGELFFKPAVYSVSKSAVLNLTRYLATYWGGSGVRVNTMTLGGVFNRQEPEFLQEYERRVPLGRMAGPHDYSGAVIFLLSDASSYMTGANLVIDGGWTAW